MNRDILAIKRKKQIIDRNYEMNASTIFIHSLKRMFPRLLFIHPMVQRKQMNHILTTFLFIFNFFTKHNGNQVTVNFSFNYVLSHT